MGKRRFHLYITQALGPISLILSIAFTPGPVWSQQDLWEQLTIQGNRARSRGALSEAESRYLQAVEVAEQFTLQDLRRAAARRNLAQTLVLQGRFVTADSLYREAIAMATIALESRHPYVLSLQDELARLQEAMAEADELDESEKISDTTIQDIIRDRALWLARRLTLQFGTIIPLNGELTNTHHQGLIYGMSLQIPLVSLGPLTVNTIPEHFITTLPNKHSLSEPFKMRGTNLTLAPALGPITLSMGAGVYTIETGRAATNHLGLIGGTSLAIKGRRSNRSDTGVQIAVRVRGLYLSDAGPGVVGPVTLLQANLSLGWRW
ncbi:MAG: hypothetical protein JSU77_02680 [Fidelibacterota bacterium]|nr:MAG: hypothetical protein JSU77_02680 [Candidatus Neomarinimicrobiota bacterium]